MLVNIRYLSKMSLFVALYHHATQVSLTYRQAKEIIDQFGILPNANYFDFRQVDELKIDLSDHVTDITDYDAIYGQGTAEEIINHLRKLTIDELNKDLITYKNKIIRDILKTEMQNYERIKTATITVSPSSSCELPIIASLYRWRNRLFAAQNQPTQDHRQSTDHEDGNTPTP